MVFIRKPDVYSKLASPPAYHGMTYLVHICDMTHWVHMCDISHLV